MFMVFGINTWQGSFSLVNIRFSRSILFLSYLCCMRKSVLLLVSCLYVISFVKLAGQNMTKDTLMIQEVNIVKSRLAQFSATENKDVIDSLQILSYANSDLSYLLSKTSLVNIVNYGGIGSQASVSLRGGGSSHTSVLWNGIPINSITTGGADLSTINVGSFDEVNVVYGASGALYGSGTFGGAIELNNIPNYSKKNDFDFFYELGSFSNQRYRASINTSNSQFSYRGQVFYSEGKNDFKYVDELDFGNPEEKLNHAENEDFGTIHNLNVKIKKNEINCGLWYQVKNHNIPGKMGFGPPISNQQQKDSTLKTFIAYKTMVKNVRLELQSAWVSDFLRYKNGYVSEIGTKRWLNTLRSRIYFNNKLNADVQLKYNTLKGEVTSYKDDEKESEYAISLDGQYEVRNFTLNASMSKDMNSVTSPPLVCNLGVSWSLIPDLVQLKIKYGTHYRRPTFNERYWIPGGNLELKSEQGVGYESSVNLKTKLVNNQSLAGHITYYYSTNENMIVWMPSDGYSKPENTNKVLANGIEVDMNWDVKFGVSFFGIGGKYAFNNTSYNDEGLANYNQKLAYKPQHIFKLTTDLKRSNWSISVNSSFQSLMKSVEGNEISSVALTDIMSRYSFDWLHFRVTINASVQNVFNKSYQLIYAYPMPGRMYSLGLNINL